MKNTPSISSNEIIQGVLLQTQNVAICNYVFTFFQSSPYRETYEHMRSGRCPLFPKKKEVIKKINKLSVCDKP